MSSTNRGAERRANDDYQTPPWAVRALLRHVKPFGTFLEPCLGSGNITHALDGNDPIKAVEWCEAEKGRDFLDQKTHLFCAHFDWIVTNPPYSLAREFIERSLAMADHVAMLLRLNFLGSTDRRDWWIGREPTALYVLTPRPRFLDRDGKPILGKNGKPGNDSCEYAWFVWSRLYSGVHVIGGD